MITFKQLVEQLFGIFEANAAGHTREQVHKWLNANGFEKVDQTGRHPKYKHTTTGYTVPGVNPHNKDVEPNAVRGLMRLVKQHHSEHNFNYTSIDDKSIK